MTIRTAIFADLTEKRGLLQLYAVGRPAKRRPGRNAV